MEFKEFVSQLGLEKDGVEKKRGVLRDYIIDLGDSDEFAKVYSLFENSSLLNLYQDTVILGEHTSGFIYFSEEFEVRLISNFDDDIYQVVIRELGESSDEDYEEDENEEE